MKFLTALSAFIIVVDASMIPKLTALPALAGVAVPAIIGGKLLTVPKILAIKGAIGLTGLKIAGAQYLKRKILVPAAIAGAQAGYKASSAVLAAPQLVAAGKAAAIQGVLTHLPQFPNIEVQPAPPVQLPDIQHTFQVPIIPSPSVQWYQKPITLHLPKLVLQQPQSVHKTITIQHHVVDSPVAAAPKPSSYAPTESELSQVGYGVTPQQQPIVEPPVLTPEQSVSYDAPELPEPNLGEAPH
ncbi:uncharacterized protein LOC111261479 [Varroa jacobsoni]|uniref:uncharacterized protein LOC111261479 n=1 Tax=Varroa jacobsoni TaxID=62625 RepID=UPI000BF2F975|nr:uncharacterized protein LOC111261479 [Varroa jacobsoni]